jgi:hypothetical protein
MRFLLVAYNYEIINILSKNRLSVYKQCSFNEKLSTLYSKNDIINLIFQHWALPWIEMKSER